VVVPAGLALTNIALATIVIAILFLARDVIVPVVLALFLPFVLAPLVGLLQRWHLLRSIAVLSSVTLAFAIVFALSAMVVTQLRQLSNDLPGYQTTVGDKFHALRETVAGSGLMQGSTNLSRARPIPWWHCSVRWSHRSPPPQSSSFLSFSFCFSGKTCATGSSGLQELGIWNAPRRHLMTQASDWRDIS
jgi:membrane protein implicated in regulation of membrane protease activity